MNSKSQVNQELTDIVIVLDRSGSMATVVDDTIGGFNTFLQGQKAAEGRARLTLTQFDTEYEIVCERKEIVEVSPLNGSTYIPRGGTALLDAIGRTISSVRGQLSSEHAGERPWKVVFVIITDGHENSSREFDRSQIFEMIRRQQENDGWEFLFLGANQDAIHEAGTIGIGADKAAAWKNADAVHRIYSEKLAQVRAMHDKSALAFDEDDRRELDEEEDESTGGPSRHH